MNVTGNRDKDSRKHCKDSGWPQKDSAEHEEYAGALTGSGITGNNITNADRPEGGLPSTGSMTPTWVGSPAVTA